MADEKGPQKGAAGAGASLGQRALISHRNGITMFRNDGNVGIGVVIAIVAVIGILIFAFIYFSGAFPHLFGNVEEGSVDQPGDETNIAYIHPSGTVRLDNSGVGTEVVTFTILDMNCIVDQERPPDTQTTFSLWAKDCNIRVVFSIAGIGTITDDYNVHVDPAGPPFFISYKDQSVEANQAFGIKQPGTYTVTMQLFDIGGDGNATLKDTAQRNVKIS